MWAWPENNPFYQKALRIETRKQNPFLIVTIALSLAFAILVGVKAAWNEWGDTSLPFYRALEGYAAEFPTYLGGNLFSYAAIITLAVCACTAVYVTRSRAGYLLREEVLKSTIQQLQLIPVAEERWLWQMSAHLVMLSLLIGCSGLPIYMLAIFTGQWHWLDLIGIALLFVGIGHVAPSWLPAQWQQVQGKPTAAAAKMQQWQEAIKRARQSVRAHDSEAAQLEAQRALRRAMSGLESSAMEPADGEPPPTPRPAFGFGRRGGPIPALVRYYFIFNLLSGVGGLFASIATSGALPLTWWRSLALSFPDSIRALMPAFIVTWPLLIARLLFTPLPFFTFALPPFLLLMPFWMGWYHQTNLTLASNVSQAETFWTTKRLKRRRTVRSILWLIGALLFFGYGWQILIVDGSLGSLLPGGLPATGLALATGWTIVIIIATLVAGGQLEEPFKRAGNGQLPQSAAWRAAARNVAQAFLTALVIYFAFCWMGGESGISTEWRQRLIPTLATAAAFILADYGSAGLQACSDPSRQSLLKTLRLVWFYILPLAALCRLVFFKTPKLGYSLDSVPYVLLSPFISLFTLLRADLWRPGAPWWWGPAAQSVFGLLCLVVTAFRVFGAQREATTEQDVAVIQISRLPTPLRILWRILTSPIVFIDGLINAFKCMTNWLDAWLVEIIVRFDNPVLTADMRTRVRREHWPLQWLTVFLLTTTCGLFASLAGQPPNTPITLPNLMASLLNNSEGVASFSVGAMWVIAGLVPIFIVGNSFDRDRANGTLVFLFLTPLSNNAILLGKILPAMLYCAMLQAALLPWMVMSCVGLLWLGKVELIGVALLGMILVIATGLYSLAVSLYFSVQARKPTEGSAKGFLTCSAIFFALLFIYFAVLQLDSFPGLVIFTACINFAIAVAAWQLSLVVMERQRHGDVAVAGKATG